MATCGCANGSCNCYFEEAADGSVIFSGSGTNTDPIILSATHPGYVRPTGRSSRSTNLAINQGTETAITMTAEDFDLDTMIDIAGAPTKITIKTAGLYLVGGYTKTTGLGATIPVFLKVRRNGTTFESIDDMQSRAGSPPAYYVQTHAFVKCNVNDYFELTTFSGTVGLQYTLTEAAFWALRIGASS